MLIKKFEKNLKKKKAISVMVSYILLIVFAIVLSAIVFYWLRTYLPGQGIECPEDTSILIEKAIFQDGNLNITIINNGLFSIAGYFIRAGKQDQKIATTDLSDKVNCSIQGSNCKKISNQIYVLGEGSGLNSFIPGEKRDFVFQEIDEFEFITITPYRLERINNRNRNVLCGGAEINKKINNIG